MNRMELRSPTPRPPANTHAAPDVQPLAVGAPDRIDVHVSALTVEAPTKRPGVPAPLTSQATRQAARLPGLPPPPQSFPAMLPNSLKARVTVECQKGWVFAGNLYEGARAQDVVGIMEHVMSQHPMLARKLFTDLPDGLLDRAKTPGAIADILRMIVDTVPTWSHEQRGEFLRGFGEVSRSPLRMMTPDQAMATLEVAFDHTHNMWASMLNAMAWREMRDGEHFARYVEQFAELASRLNAERSGDFRHAISNADRHHSVDPCREGEPALIAKIAERMPQYLLSCREAANVWLEEDADKAVNRVLKSSTPHIPKSLANACAESYPQLQLLTTPNLFTSGDKAAWAKIFAHFPDVPWIATFAQTFKDAPEKVAHANAAKVRCLGEFLMLAQYVKVAPEKLAGAEAGFNILINHHDPAQRHALVAGWVDVALAGYAPDAHFKASTAVLEGLRGTKAKSAIIQFAVFITGNGALFDNDRAMRYFTRQQLLNEPVAMRNSVSSLLALSDPRPLQKQAIANAWQAIFASPTDAEISKRVEEGQRNAEAGIVSLLTSAQGRGPQSVADLADNVQVLRDSLGTLSRVRDAHVELLSHRAAGNDAGLADEAKALLPLYGDSLAGSVQQGLKICDLVAALPLTGAQALAVKARNVFTQSIVDKTLRSEIKALRRAVDSRSGTALVLQGLSDVIETLPDIVATTKHIETPSTSSRVPTDLLTRTASTAKGSAMAKEHAIAKFYADELAPVLRLRLNYTEMLNRMGTCPTPEEVADLDVLSKKLFDSLPSMTSPNAARQFVDTLLAMRNYHNYIIFVSRLGMGHTEERAFLSDLQYALADGTYDAHRLVDSPQMQAVTAKMSDPQTFIEAWQAGASKPISEGRRGFVAEDTGRFEDIINGGTEVDGSCQHVSYDGELNHGLLGRLEDASKRQLVIKDETGTQIARGMWRVLTDDEGRAYLHLDEIYVASQQITKAEAKKILHGFAKERGEALKLPVVVNAHTVGDEARDVGVAQLISRARDMPDYFDVAGIGLTSHDVKIPAADLKFLPV